MGELVLMFLIGFSCAFAGWLMVYAAARWEKESHLARAALLANDLHLKALDQARSATQRSVVMLGQLNRRRPHTGGTLQN
jgi:hypothetical protein